MLLRTTKKDMMGLLSLSHSRRRLFQLLYVTETLFIRRHLDEASAYNAQATVTINSVVDLGTTPRQALVSHEYTCELPIS